MHDYRPRLAGRSSERTAYALSRGQKGSGEERICTVQCTYCTPPVVARVRRAARLGWAVCRAAVERLPMPQSNRWRAVRGQLNCRARTDVGAPAIARTATYAHPGRDETVRRRTVCTYSTCYIQKAHLPPCPVVWGRQRETGPGKPTVRGQQRPVDRTPSQRWI